MPVHIEVATTAAPMQKARSSPFAKTMPVISQPETAIQRTPMAIWLMEAGKTVAKPQNKASAVITQKRVRMLNWNFGLDLAADMAGFGSEKLRLMHPILAVKSKKHQIAQPLAATASSFSMLL